MKKILIYVGMMTGLAVPHAWGVQCPDGVPYTAYFALGSCTIGDKVFSNFSFTSSAQGGATAVTEDGVTVDTMGPSSTGASKLSTDIGLQFNASWVATAGQASDSAIDFTVTVINGSGLLIKDIGLAQVSGVTPDGSASVAEKGCGPAPCSPGTISILTFDDGTPASQTTANTIFTPVGSIQVVKDINVSGGSHGFAQLSLVQDTFSQTSVPEPASIILLGSLMVGVCGIIRRRQTRKL